MKLFPLGYNSQRAITTLLLTLSSSGATAAAVEAPWPKGGGGSIIADKLWHELGRGIGNESLSDLAGYSIATSASGYTVAVGSPSHTSLIKSNPPKRAGRVRVYRYDSNRDAWAQLGQDLEGSGVGDEFGSAIHLNDDGDVLAVGYPSCSRNGKKECGCVDVYELTLMVGPEDQDRDVWFQVGVTVVGDASLEKFGTSVHIEEVYDDESDLDTYALAVGAPGARVHGVPTGMVYFYDFEWEVGRKTLDWNERGTITPTLVGGDNTSDMAKKLFSYSNFGQSISMTGDSTMILVGAPNYGENDEGTVILYRQQKTSYTVEWDEVSDFEVLNPTKSYQYNCGTSVSIDWSGNYIAYGCPGATFDSPNDVELFQVGCVHTFRKAPTTVNDSSIVYQPKQVVYGEGEGDLSGYAVKLSKLDDGHIFMAVGAPKNSPLADNSLNGETLSEAGHVRVYYSRDRDSNGLGDWEQAGLDVDGISATDHYGSSVAISNRGHIVAAGAPEGGYAKIFNLDYTAPPTPGPTYGSGSDGNGNGGGGYGSGGVEHGTGYGGGSQKSSASVWFVFFISIFAIGTIFALFIVAKKIRERGGTGGIASSSRFMNVNTQDQDASMMNNGGSTEMVSNPNRGVVSSTGEARDII